MLGEIVDLQFEKKSGDSVSSGEIIGAIEGFKAISDIYCVIDGRFAGGNSALQTAIERVTQKFATWARSVRFSARAPR